VTLGRPANSHLMGDIIRVHRGFIRWQPT